ncbi:MAG: oligosaccharide flippase family protein [Bacteroidota bacterium]
MISSVRAFLDRLTNGSGFIKAVSTLLSGTLVALIISYLAQPVLARLYTPEAFGLLDALVAIIALLVPFATLRYEDALMLPENEEEALGILGLTFLLVLIVSGSCLLLLLFKDSLIALLPAAAQESTLLPHLLWIPPALAAIRFAKLTELWLNRKKAYAAISSGQVAQTGVMTAVRIVMAQFTNRMLPIGLISGYIAGYVASTIWYLRQITQLQKQFFRGIGNGTYIRFAARRYRRFPIYAMPSTLLNTLQSRLPVLLLLVFFGEAIVGYYGRAFALFAVPLSLIGYAISQVFFVEGADAIRTKTLPQLTTKVHSRLITVGLFPTLALMLTGPEVVRLFLGAPWETAGVYLRWLAPWFFLASIASPLTRIFDLLEKQRIEFVTSTTIFVLQISLFLYGCFTGDITQAIFYLALGGVLARIIHIVVMLRLAGTPARAAFTAYLKQLSIASPFLLVLYAVSLLDRPLITVAALVLTGLGFLGVVYRTLTSEAATGTQSRSQ